MGGRSLSVTDAEDMWENPWWSAKPRARVQILLPFVEEDEQAG